MVSREKRKHAYALYMITGAVALAILSRLFWVAVVQGPQEQAYRDPAVAQRVVRGTITDRNGRLLAIETPYHGCALLLREIKDLNLVANLIGPILSINAQQIIDGSSRNRSYYLVKRRLGQDELEQLTKIIKEHGLAGVVIEKRYGRTYPQHFHGAQVIGFTNTENRGIEGIELSYEDTLSPYPGLNETITYGNDLVLTLDMELQYLLDNQAVAIDREHLPDSVVGIIMGAKNGEILAATTFPWYDPTESQSSLEEERQNRVVTAMFEPGSVFKIFSLAAELSADQADVSEPFLCDGSYTFTMENGEQATINCVTGHGPVTPETMLQLSCNGAVAHWALQTNDQAFRSKLSDFGFGTRWTTGMPGAIAGILASTDSWSGRTKATISFGQEIGVTALHMAIAATAIANDGNLMQPFIVKEIRDQAGAVVHTQESTIREQIISPAVAATVLEGMEMATLAGGTATRAAVNGVRVAAKTGTAQIADSITGKYLNDSFLASTLAIVPVDDPEYIIYIGVANPTGATIWGSNIAAPAIGSIITDMVRQGKIRSSVIKEQEIR